jgi:predicted component of type VI protein secretion system
MTLAGTRLEEVLLALKVAFLVLLYLFIWRIVRTVGRDPRVPQESFILKPQTAAAVGLTVQSGRLIVKQSPHLEEGEEFELDSEPLTIGRAAQNDVSLERDEFASARHLRIDPRRDGVWIQDLGSTNGTYVNGIRLDGPRRLSPGDIVRVGETELRFAG